MPLTLANKITIVRMLLIPVFIILVLYFDKSMVRHEQNEVMRWISTGIFLGIFFLDALDGYFARKRNEITRLGAILDPLTDKAMLLSALILLSLPSTTFESSLPLWFLVLVISRDVILVGGALIIQSIAGHVVVKPRLSGKCTTFFQAIVVLWVLTGLAPKVFIFLVGIAAAATLFSGVQYVFDGIRQLEKSNNSGK
jgi:cardiolipin synthase (CMP-forming)